ncbi:hypothetical protein PGC34_10565 [Pseudomonas kribbensis]|uniref:hypothetical protein n=1 Tax=Pseudomonas TaxID=286 RepID=UPI00200FECAB|nr:MULTISPECIES: hypothetical protein [unclassified Pseudomonas]MDL5597085.1 hypothetical protein [Bacillus subtilis]
MNYLEKEIDSVLEEQKLANKKLSETELANLINDLTIAFFSSPAKKLDPYFLKNTEKNHDPEFWKKVDTIDDLEYPTIIVHDNKAHAWKLESSTDLKALLLETTGFPFWIIGENFKTLTYMDDHDCVHISKKTNK